MRFLKALQKVDVDDNFDGDGVDRSQPAGENGNAMPEVLGSNDLKIGGPNSVIRRQTERAATANAPAIAPAAVSVISVGHAGAEDVELRFQQFSVDAANVNPRLVAITRPQSAYCEQYRSLRTHVLHKSQERDLQSIVVASVGPGEGKSVTALNLAWLLAQTSEVRCLIIDSDLRMPSLCDYLGVATKTGLSQVLDGTATLQQSIIELQPSGLCLLPGGQHRSDVAELLSGTKFKELLLETRGMFDYVIIDAPPLAIFTDAAVLINHADGALLVVRANQTRFNDIDRVLESLPRNRLLGTVLNDSDERLVKNEYYGYAQYRKLLAE